MADEYVPKVKVKHIIAYLKDNYDPDAAVYLDKDGWQEDDELDAFKIIDQAGIFDKYDNDLFINN